MRTARHQDRLFEAGLILVVLCVLPVAALFIAYAVGVPVPPPVVALALSLCLVAAVWIAIRYGRRTRR